MPSMPVLPAFDNTANVVAWRQVGGVVGNRNMGGLDAETGEQRTSMSMSRLRGGIARSGRRNIHRTKKLIVGNMAMMRPETKF